MMLWIAEIDIPPGMPIDQIHVMLYSYFPQVQKGDARPYVWRLIGPGRAVVMSKLRPSSASARQIAIPEAPTTYDFAVTFKRVRNVGGTYTRDDGTKRNRTPKAVAIDDPAELSERMKRWVSGRGGDIGFVRIGGMRELSFPSGPRRITIPICDAVGKVLIRAPEAFSDMLWRGGPGTGKAYGCGMWWMPEIMERTRAAA